MKIITYKITFLPHLVFLFNIISVGPKHNCDSLLSDEWSMEDKVLFEQAFNSHGKSFKKLQATVSNILIWQTLCPATFKFLNIIFMSWAAILLKLSLVNHTVPGNLSLFIAHLCWVKLYGWNIKGPWYIFINLPRWYFFKNGKIHTFILSLFDSSKNFCWTRLSCWWKFYQI